MIVAQFAQNKPLPKNRLSCVKLVFIALLAALPAVLLWPVDTLTLRDDEGRVVFREAMPLGSGFATRYIHSLGLSPVEDEYTVQDGLIRQWRSRIQSHNAGMSVQALDRGRVYMDPPWVVIEGAIISLESFTLRVGNENFGRNHLRIGKSPWQPLYRTIPNTRLHFAASRSALYKLWLLSP